MGTVKRFEDVQVWQLARALSKKIYPLTYTDPFSNDRRLRDQIRGTLGSIMDNIAEGFGRGSKNEMIASLSIAKGEAEELKSQLYRCFDNQFISNEVFDSLYNEADKVVNKLGSFIRYLNQSKFKGQKFKNRS